MPLSSATPPTVVSAPAPRSTWPACPLTAARIDPHSPPAPPRLILCADLFVRYRLQMMFFALVNSVLGQAVAGPGRDVPLPAQIIKVLPTDC